jgi:SH3-like domain-containing protein
LLISTRAWAEPACAKGYISLRKSPSATAPLSWKVAKYMPFMVTEKKNGWAKVQDMDGEVHWAKLTDLNFKNRCVVVKVNVAVLRAQPSKTAPPAALRTVDRYTPFLRIEHDEPGEWLEVADETGSRAWVHENYVWKPVVVNSFSF